MTREPIPTWYFVLVVVRRDDQFLIVQERKHGQLWFLPAGRVELGETFVAAAYRETLEESGISVRLTGVLRVEHSLAPAASRLRVVFLAEPLDDTPPKSVPDEESLGATWASLEQLSNYPLRSQELRDLFAYVAAGSPVYPLSILQHEGSPYKLEA